MKQLAVQVCSYLLVLRGVTAPVSFTNLEKSLAKSAPAEYNKKLALRRMLWPASCITHRPAGGSGLFVAQTMRLASLV